MTGMIVCIIIGILCLIFSVAYLVVVLNYEDRMKEPFAIFLSSASGISLLFCILKFRQQKKFQDGNVLIVADMNVANNLYSNEQVY